MASDHHADRVISVLLKPEVIVSILVSLIKFLPTYALFAVQRMLEQVALEISPVLAPPADSSCTLLWCLATYVSTPHFNSWLGR
eukprot:12266578-Karenia_brevis.AAC.1